MTVEKAWSNRSPSGLTWENSASFLRSLADEVRESDSKMPRTRAKHLESIARALEEFAASEKRVVVAAAEALELLDPVRGEPRVEEARSKLAGVLEGSSQGAKWPVEYVARFVESGIVASDGHRDLDGAVAAALSAARSNLHVGVEVLKVWPSRDGERIVARVASFGLNEAVKMYVFGE